ncbi:MAG: protease SohB [Pseudomonadota bacterium]
MTYLFDYLVFLAEVITIVVAIMVIVGFLANNAMKQMPEQSGHLMIRKLNQEVKDLKHAMQGALLDDAVVKVERKAEAKAEKKNAKEAAKEASKAAKVAAKTTSQETAQPATGDGTGAGDATPDDERKPRTFVLNFEGDVKASSVEFLRREISAVLTMAEPKDEVVACIESPGGMVHSYGLAASQLARVRGREIPLTVVVDKVAASGGYLMAAVANKILAAPFALIGSIGVVAQIPNVHRLLKKNDVDVEVLTAGKHKRTLTTFGENTEEGRAKFIEELEDVHTLFQSYVTENRPELDIATVATGEAWYGTRALELNLIDGISTSDEYLLEACERSDVFAISWIEHKKPIDKLMGRVNGVLDQAQALLQGWR